jgi:hypothetical protein
MLVPSRPYSYDMADSVFLGDPAMGFGYTAVLSDIQGSPSGEARYSKLFEVCIREFGY